MRSLDILSHLLRTRELADDTSTRARRHSLTFRLLVESAEEKRRERQRKIRCIRNEARERTEDRRGAYTEVEEEREREEPLR